RKRNSSTVGLESSPDSDPDDEEHKRRQPGVKRACNECRQQKLRCDVVQDPYQPCSRCIKHKLDCRIDSNFKRVGKRSRFAELERNKELLERQIQELKQQVSTSKPTPPPQSMSPFFPPPNGPNGQSSAMYAGLSNSPDQQHLGSHEAVASLLDLKQGLDGSAAGFGASPNSRLLRSLEEVVLAPHRVNELFEEYWSNYHGFLELLDPEQSPDSFFDQSKLLFWTIIVIAARQFGRDRELLSRLTAPYTRLVWGSMSKVPQNYNVVKALCLLCAWPLPTSSTSTDPTFMFCGLMMQIAKQIGLHRPSHAQDFTRTHINLKDEDVKDRLKTWACCNIVAQNIATGYGQPPDTLYDATLDFGDASFHDTPLPTQVAQRLALEKFCNHITKTLYSNEKQPNDIFGERQDSIRVNMLAQAMHGLETRLDSSTNWLPLHLSAVRLHLRLHTFFDPPSSPTYSSDLQELYQATTNFLDVAMSDELTGLKYATSFIMQMMLAAGFALFKLLNSFFVVNVDRDYGRNLFYRTIRAIRNMSVITNDLPQRLAEVLVQLWKASGEGFKYEEDSDRPPTRRSVDHNVQLKVRCRMSMSLLYDSVWRWREELQGKVRVESLDKAVKNPTSPEATS
ncbi:hypothetical protein P152DRAFT_369526, partial [Eremomyces bilateralis CBS 781.70]